MATHSTVTTWKNDLLFESTQDNGEVVYLHSPGEGKGREGASPKMLLLNALAGCTAIDVGSLLPKMRVPFTSLVVRVTGELTEEHPKVYSTIHVIYEVGTSADHLESVQRAVDLSVERYCGVHAMLAKAATITHEIRLVE